MRTETERIETMGHWKEHLYYRMPISIQNSLLSLHARRLGRIRFDAGYGRLRHDLAVLERSSPDEQRAYQSERLERLIRHCYENVPYYRRLFQARGLSPKDVQTPEDLVKLPILTKDGVRENFRDLLTRTTDARRLRLAHTSGTTGSSLSCYWDEEVDRATNAVLWQHRSWAGFEFGSPHATLLGRMIVPPGQDHPPFWRFNRAWNQLFLSSFHLDDRTAPSYLEALHRFQPKALESYASTAHFLALQLRARGEYLPLKAVFTSTETLLPIQREVIEERFRCRVYDYLGAAERVLFAGECPVGEGMHLFTAYGITEVTDDGGCPRRAGELGHLIVTGLHNFAMPLIRYRIGDVSGILPGVCRCGRTLPRMHSVTTKAEDIIVTPEGRFISPSVMTHPFKPMSNIIASHIIQESTDSLSIRIVRGPSYTEKDSEIFMRELRKRVGERIRIDLDFVEKIPRTATGKLRWVISKVPLRFAGEAASNLYAEEDDR